MQAKKEHFTGLVKTIKNKVHDWWVSYPRKLWTARIFVHGFLLLVAIFVGAVTFAHFNLFHTDADSARYMLSALVQSQAAIVAIVITLTLIAVQLTASAYSPRVIDIFKKNPDMWILLGCYGVSIFYGFIVLKLVEGEFVSQSTIWSLGFVSISFEFGVSLAYWLGVFTFVVLFPYMWNIISLLKSENIIKRLAIEITEDKLLKYIKFAKTSEGVKTSTVDDPIQPIVDIIHGSIMKYDLETTRVGLKAVTERVLEIIATDGEREISRHFCDHLQRVSRLAISKEDEESTIEVIKNLENFCKSTAERKLKGATLYAVGSLREIGKAAAKKELEDATEEAVWSLRGIVKAAAEKELEDATQYAVRSLGEVGKAAAKKELEDATERVAWSLREIGKADAEKKLKEATRYAAGSLGEVGKAAAEKELEDATERVGWSLGEVGKAAAEKELENATGEAVRSLGEVGKAAAEKGLEDATERAAEELGEVGKAAAEKGLENATRQAAGSLAKVGSGAAEKSLEVAVAQAAESLAELTISSEGVVKNAIQIYESGLTEKDHVSFQKFMKIYEQKLEKLRAEK